MKKTSLIILLCIAFIGQITSKGFGNSDEMGKAWDEAEKRIRQLIPELPALADKYPNDVEIQLGIAALYDKYGTPRDPSIKSSYELVQDHQKKVSDQLQKVFAIDPNNRPAIAISTERRCQQFTSKRNMLFKYLYRLIDNARGRNAKEISLYRGDSLEEYFEKNDKGRVVINDFDLAKKQLCEKIDKEIPEVLAALDNAQSKDPDNAFYNYLKAHLYFELDEKDKALNEIEEGVAKKYFSSYPEELAGAMAKVLRELDFPQPHRDVILGIRSPFEAFIRERFWGEELSDIGKSYEAKGDFKSAEEIYRLTIEMAQQVQKEQIYGPLGLDKVAQKRIEALSKDAQGQIIKYAVVGLGGLLIITVTILLKKKTHSRGK
jgi:hypothetical protein